MARPRKLTKDEIAAAHVMWLAGARRKIMAARLDVSERTIYYLIQEFEKLQKPVIAEEGDSQSSPSTPNLASTANR